MLSIAIDGPSGAGKSSVAKKLGKLLNVLHLNTGALYRAVAIYLYENKINPCSEEDVKKALNKINVKIDFINGEQYTYLNNEQVNNKLYSSDISDYASKSSALKCVRDKLLSIQQDIAKQHHVILEGRDTTTVVLPNATYKFFLTASAENRAKRRLLELEQKGEHITYEECLKDIIARDNRDSNREINPLRMADDAIYINSDNYTLEEVVAIMYSFIKERV